jgi:hypothetical protein
MEMLRDIVTVAVTTGVSERMRQHFPKEKFSHIVTVLVTRPVTRTSDKMRQHFPKEKFSHIVSHCSGDGSCHKNK